MDGEKNPWFFFFIQFLQNYPPDDNYWKGNRKQRARAAREDLAQAQSLTGGVTDSGKSKSCCSFMAKATVC